MSDRPLCRNNLIHQSNKWISLSWLLFVGVTVFILCLPFMRFVFGWGDEGILLNGAERLLQGRRLYIDFFEILPPGGFVIMAAWFGITGISILSARLLAILTITGIACFTYLACRQASKHAPSSALVAVGWAIMSQGLWTQINHHWFTTLFSMVAAWATLASMGKPQRWQWEPLIAGIAAGVAPMVTPTCGALAMLASAASFVDLRFQRTKFIAFLLGSALVPICLLAFMIWQGALAGAFDDVIAFNAAGGYLSINVVPFGSFADYHNQSLIYLFPLVGLLTVITCGRQWRTSFHDPLFRSCLAFGVAGFIGCFPRPDIVHIAFVMPLACPLLTYCTHRIVASWLPKYRYALIALVLIIVVPSVIGFSFVAYVALHGEPVATPRGRVGLFAKSTRELVARIATAPSSDRYFFYPYMPMLPFLTAREQVSKYELFVPGYTTPSQYQDACISALGRASWLVIWTDFAGFKVELPGRRDPDPPEKEKFELALNRGFEFVARYGSLELRQRVKTVDETACAGIAE